MILRDFLAVDRTVMANESSFLSYIRTSLTFVVGAMTFFKFFDGTVFHIIGWMFIICAVLLTVHGATRYEAMESILHKLTGDLQSESDTPHARLSKRLILASQSFGRLLK